MPVHGTENLNTYFIYAALKNDTSAIAFAQSWE